MRFAAQFASGCSLLGLALLAACGDSSRPNVLIITVDTLRADFLGSYGDLETGTPHLDALANDSTLFERAAAPMPMTRPSHFSMLTSKYPREQGVVSNSRPLPKEALSLAEILSSAGYRTAAFVGVQLLGRRSGAAQGFDVFDYPQTTYERPAEQVVTNALEWIHGPTDWEPFLAWVHLFDPHDPYAPPIEFRPAAAGDRSTLGWQEFEAIAAANHGDVPDQVLEEALALYRG